MNTFRNISALSVLAGVILVGTACSTPSVPAPSSSASAAVIEQPVETPTPEPTTSSYGLPFGQINEWEDGLAISVSEPMPFTPTQYAAGGTGGTAVYFKIVLTNNSAEPFSPLAYESVSSGGKEASAIFDVGNPVGDFGTVPSTAVLPGGTVEWLVAYDVADPASIIVQISPDPFYDEALFTNVAK